MEGEQRGRPTTLTPTNTGKHLQHKTKPKENEEQLQNMHMCVCVVMRSVDHCRDGYGGDMFACMWIQYDNGVRVHPHRLSRELQRMSEVRSIVYVLR